MDPDTYAREASRAEVDIQGYQKQIANLQAQVNQTRNQQQALQSNHDPLQQQTVMQKVSQLDADIERWQSEIRSLEGNVSIRQQEVTRFHEQEVQARQEQDEARKRESQKDAEKQKRKDQIRSRFLGF